MLPNRILRFASLPEPQRTAQLSDVLQRAVKGGLLYDARDIADLLGQKLSDEQLEAIYHRCVELRWFADAREALALMIPD